MILPKKIELAQLPTPIFPFNPLKENYDGVNLYIKRDDFTGMEVTGNKIRKLEFCVAEALEQNSDVLITCGGLQSNHCRATAAVAAQLGLKSHLVLRIKESSEPQNPDANYFLDILFGAEFTFVNQDEYKYSRGEIMEKIKADYAARGLKAYVMPEGASNGMGMFGYYNAYEEILRQEEALGITFDVLCSTEGSGGTYAGLYAANEIHCSHKKIVAFNIYNKNADVRKEIEHIVRHGAIIGQHNDPVEFCNIHVINEYAGAGYGIADSDVIDFIKQTAGNTGTVFDPVYTGKALFGLISEIKKHNPLLNGNVLFIHTGGLYGIFPQKGLF